MFSQASFAELGPAAQVTVGLCTDVGVDDHAVFGDRNFEMFQVTGAVEEFPVLVSLDCRIPSQLGDGIASRQERIT